MITGPTRLLLKVIAKNVVPSFIYGFGLVGLFFAIGVFGRLFSEGQQAALAYFSAYVSTALWVGILIALGMLTFVSIWGFSKRVANAENKDIS